MSQPRLVAATQCVAMQEGLVQSWYCEPCVDAVDQAQLGITLRGSQHTFHESPLEEEDSIETAESIAVTLLISPPWTVNTAKVLVIPQQLKDPVNKKK